MVIKGRGGRGVPWVRDDRPSWMGGRAGPGMGVCENLNAGKLQLTMHAYVAMQHKAVCALGN
jgi:hypothetical protein